MILREGYVHRKHYFQSLCPMYIHKTSFEAVSYRDEGIFSFYIERANEECDVIATCSANLMVIALEHSSHGIPLVIGKEQVLNLDVYVRPQPPLPPWNYVGPGIVRCSFSKRKSKKVVRNTNLTALITHLYLYNTYISSFAGYCTASERSIPCLEKILIKKGLS